MDTLKEQDISRITKEIQLLDTIERIEREQGWCVWHLHLSRMQPNNRRCIAAAMGILEKNISFHGDQIYLLSTFDVALILQNPDNTFVENTIRKFRELFSEDPLVFAADNNSRFMTYYDLDSSYGEFLGIARKILAEARYAQTKEKLTSEMSDLEPEKLGIIVNKLSNANLGLLIRRQAAIAINRQGNADVIFHECYVSLADLQRIVAPDADLFSNNFLFNHLCLTLDLRVINSLRTLHINERPPMFSLNMSILTMLSDDFQEFLYEQSTGIRFSFEFQIADIIANSMHFSKVCSMLHENGHYVIIDGLNEMTMRFMDVTKFNADLYKIFWSPKTKNSIHDNIVHVGNDKVLLARCDSEKAIAWGLVNGIFRFQGRHVDALLAAYTMKHCNKSAACTLRQCIDRHGVIDGPLRSACGNQDILDSSPSINFLPSKA